MMSCHLTISLNPKISLKVNLTCFSSEGRWPDMADSFLLLNRLESVLGSVSRFQPFTWRKQFFFSTERCSVLPSVLQITLTTIVSSTLNRNASCHAQVTQPSSFKGTFEHWERLVRKLFLPIEELLFFYEWLMFGCAWVIYSTMN